MKIKIGLYCLLLIITLVGCGKQEQPNMPIEAQIIPETTLYEEQPGKGNIAAENSKYALYYQESTGTFTLKNKKGAGEFHSISQSPTVPAESSLFEVRYVDTQGNLLTMNTFRDSVSKGQYKTEYLENGVKITFTLGDVAGKVFCPGTMSIERFEGFLSKVEDKFSQGKLKSMYYIPELASMKKDAADKIRELYPNIEETPVYILRKPDMTTSQKKEISEILVSAGYTQEDFDMDSAGQSQTTSNKKPVFNISLYLTLEKDYLRARIPMEEIIEYNNGKLLSITLLSYFGSPRMGEKGSFLLPDGIGSEMDFYNGKGQMSPAIIPVYGKDYSVPAVERIYSEERAYLPVYGVRYRSSGMLAAISDGESFAELTAWPGDENLDAYISPVFVVRQSMKTYLGSTATGAESFLMMQKELYQGNLQIDYTLLGASENTVENMGQIYGERLYGTNSQAKRMASLYLEFIGSAYEKRNEFSILPPALYTITTLSEVRAVLEDIRTEEKEVPLVVILRGFGKNGMEEKGLNGFSMNGKCGTQKELDALLEWGKNNQTTFYLEFDPLYVANDSLFDGFSKNRDTVTMVNRITGFAEPYVVPFLTYDTYEESGKYILNASAINKKINNYSKDSDNYNFTGIALGNAGKELNADFSQNSPLERQETRNAIEQTIRVIKEQSNFITNGANAYLLPYMRHVRRIDLSKDKLDIADRQVNFLPAVVGGRTGISDFPVNLSSNSERFVQKSLDSMAGFTYVFTGKERDLLRKTSYTEYFSTDYAVWKEDIQKKAHLIKEQSGSVNAQK